MIYLAADHGGFALKEKIKQILADRQMQIKDIGAQRHQTEDDYPDYVIPLAEQVARHQAEGIISCRSGQGAAIAANKVPGIRAVVCWNEACARSSRTDDHANVLSLPADYLTFEEAERIVTAWLATPYSNDARHLRRLQAISDYERDR